MWLLKIPVTVVTVTQKVEAVNHRQPEVNRATNRTPRAYCTLHTRAYPAQQGERVQDVQLCRRRKRHGKPER